MFIKFDTVIFLQDQAYTAASVWIRTTSKDTLEGGCTVEVVDITDLDHAIDLAEQDNAVDVLDVFNFLRNSSYNHYWSFDNQLRQMGIHTRCCSLGEEYCHLEYPKK